MKPRRVVLVATVFQGDLPVDPLAPDILASYATSRIGDLDCRVKRIPVLAPPYAPGVVDEILAGDPEVVGLSACCWDQHAYRWLVSEIKRRSPSARVVVGGPLATFWGVELMAEVPGIDVAVVGEGERTFVELLGGGLSRPDRVRGIVYRDAAGLARTPPRELIADLDEIPSPFLTGRDVGPGRWPTVELSRGCAHACRYCTWSNRRGAVRFRSAKGIAAEVRGIRELGHRHVFVADAALNLDHGHMDANCAAMRIADPGSEIAWSVCLHYQHFREPQVEFLRGLRTDLFAVALESVNSAALAMNRRPAVDRARFAHVVAALAAIAPVDVLVILGMVGDTLDGFKKTIDYLVGIAGEDGRQRIRKILVSWMIAPQGSYFHRRKERLGLTISDGALPLVIGSPTFPADDFARAAEFLLADDRRRALVWPDAEGGHRALAWPHEVMRALGVPSLAAKRRSSRRDP